MNLLIILLAIFGATYAQIEPFGTEICRLFANGVQLRQPGTCEAYITCQNAVSKITDCKGKLYDKESGKCATKTSDAYCKQPCTSKSSTWMADPKSCNGYYRCAGSVGTLGYCPEELHFNQKQQSCVYEEDSTCEGYKYCDVVPNNVPFKNDADCQKYFMCLKSKLTEYVCEKGYYDVHLGCVKKADVECSKHPVPINACGTAKKPIRNKFVSDERTCRGYYYCQDRGDNVPDLQPTWGQCPEGKFFDYDVQACYPPAAVACEEDRCEGRDRDFVISGTPGCQHYLICNGNETLMEQKCPDGLYFDDDKMECVASILNYVACS